MKGWGRRTSVARPDSRTLVSISVTVGRLNWEKRSQQKDIWKLAKENVEGHSWLRRQTMPANILFDLSGFSFFSECDISVFYAFWGPISRSLSFPANQRLSNLHTYIGDKNEAFNVFSVLELKKKDGAIKESKCDYF